MYKYSINSVVNQIEVSTSSREEAKQRNKESEKLADDLLPAPLEEIQKSRKKNNVPYSHQNYFVFIFFLFLLTFGFFSVTNSEGNNERLSIHCRQFAICCVGVFGVLPMVLQQSTELLCPLHDLPYDRARL
ncbi:uncharacterized protein LOC106873869 [Octopus bimaculoides]|uniref:uncharacterized protein LOC106873869 n=1 Tax=Octopus bimaculoides TaxID=37653 RepID=UPI0022E46821|nr:uncharacterized protein LOC106873869 [Octopus bimaculoides]